MINSKLHCYICKKELYGDKSFTIEYDLASGNIAYHDDCEQGVVSVEVRNEIVFGLTKRRAARQLSRILKDIYDRGVETVERVISDVDGVTNVKTNERVIRVVSIGLNARGYKPHFVFVDTDISIKWLHQVIYPMLNVKYKNFDWKDRIIYFDGDR